MDLSTLPTEIVEEIAWHLDIRSLKKLRLVSRAINAKTHRPSMTTIFGTIKTDLSPRSLQKLEDQWATDEFSPYAEYVHTLKLSGYYGFGHGYRWNIPVDYPETRPGILRFERLLIDRFPNCRSFYVYSLAWGREDPDDLTAEEVVDILLSMIARTGITVKEFHLPEIPTQPSIDFGDMTLTWNVLEKPELIDSFSSMRALTFVPGLLATSYAYILNARILSAILLPAKNVTSLKFGCKTDIQELASILQAPERTGLRSMEIVAMHLTEEDLMAVLTPCNESLRELTIRNVCLKTGSWKTLLSVILELLPHLEGLSIANIAEMDTGSSSSIFLCTCVLPNSSFANRYSSFASPYSQFSSPESNDTYGKAGNGGFIPNVTFRQNDVLFSSIELFNGRRMACGFSYAGQNMAETLAIVLKAFRMQAISRARLKSLLSMQNLFKARVEREYYKDLPYRERHVF